MRSNTEIHNAKCTKRSLTFGGGGHEYLKIVVTAKVQKALDLTLWDLDLDLRLEFGIGLVNILQTVSKKSIL